MINRDQVSEWGEWALYAESDGEDSSMPNEETVYGRDLDPYPGRMILIADPTYLSPDALAELLEPNSEGHRGAVLIEGPFGGHSSHSGPCNIELRATNYLFRQPCAHCGAPTLRRTLDAYCGDQVVCPVCVPELVSELQSAGYELAQEAARNRPFGSGGAYFDALYDFAENLTRRESS